MRGLEIQSRTRKRFKMKQKGRCFEEIMYYRFADNELEPGSARKIKEHLDTCPGCSTFVREIKAENRSLQEMFAAAPPIPDVTHLVMKRLNKKRMFHLSVRRLAYAATFLLVIFLTIFYLIREPGSAPARKHQVLVHSARVEGQAAQPHIFESKDPDVKFIWLEKFEEEKKETEGNNETII